ncbi:MAG: hypothetical protein M1482_12760, partial [Chloroflexi bacterium]|nr:hypothetical protein [Chloroflexota bacterium]
MTRSNWIPQSLAARLLLTYVTLMAVGIGGVIAWTGQRLADESIQQAQRELSLQSNIIANALRDPLERPDGNVPPGSRSVDSLVSSYAQSIGGRVTLVNPQFATVLSSDSRVPAGAPENDVELTSARTGTAQ